MAKLKDRHSLNMLIVMHKALNNILNNLICLDCALPITALSLRHIRLEILITITLGIWNL